MKHTQGPWRVREGALYKEGTTEVNPNLPQRVCPHCKKAATFADGSLMHEPARISIDAKGWGVAQIGTLDPVGEFEQHMANARVIAAVPRLIETLRGMVSISRTPTQGAEEEAYAYWQPKAEALLRELGEETP